MPPGERRNGRVLGSWIVADGGEPVVSQPLNKIEIQGKATLGF